VKITGRVAHGAITLSVCVCVCVSVCNCVWFFFFFLKKGGDWKGRSYNDGSFSTMKPQIKRGKEKVGQFGK
jgi:hypothetical protein